MFFFFNGDDIQGRFTSVDEPLREELERHRVFAHGAAKVVSDLMTLLPVQPWRHGGDPPRNLGAPDRDWVDSFCASLEAVRTYWIDWPRISDAVSQALIRGITESGEMSAPGRPVSCVLALHAACTRLGLFAASVRSAHKAHGDAIDEIVARHLTDCLADYESSEIGMAIGLIDFSNVEGVIDREIAAAKTPAAKHLASPNMSAPAAPSAATKPAAKPEAAPVTRTKAQTWKLVAAYLFHTHHVDNRRLGKADPVRVVDLCEALGISRGAAVSSWFKKHFGSHRQYCQLCLRRPEAVAIVLSDQQGETLSREKSTSRGSREDSAGLDELDPRKDKRRRNHDSDDDESDEDDDSDDDFDASDD